MELADYVRVLRRRWLSVAVVVLLCIGVAAAVTLRSEPVYTASAQYLLTAQLTTSEGEAADNPANRAAAAQAVPSFAQLGTTRPAVQDAVDAAGVPGALPTVQMSVVEDEPLLNVTVSDASPNRAAAVANAYGKTLPASLEELQQIDDAGSWQLRALQPATVPTSPSSPNVTLNLLIGLLVGLLLGLIGALLRESLDRRLADSVDTERQLGATVLAAVPLEHRRSPLAARTHPQSLRAEAYRKLRTNLLFSTPEGLPPSIAVTSALAAEGKSTVAANLAVTCARAGQRVVLVEADLRRPSLDGVLRLHSDQGLTEVLDGRLPLDDALLDVDDLLTYLPCGSIPTSPSEMLGSIAFADLLRDLEHRFDLVLVDTPPVLPVSDALQVAVQTHGVVVVHRIGSTAGESLGHAIKALERVNATVLGVVSNGVAHGRDGAYGYGATYSYESRAGRKAVAPTRVPDPSLQGVSAEPRPSRRGRRAAH